MHRLGGGGIRLDGVVQSGYRLRGSLLVLSGPLDLSLAISPFIETVDDEMNCQFEVLEELGSDNWAVPLMVELNHSIPFDLLHDAA